MRLPATLVTVVVSLLVSTGARDASAQQTRWYFAEGATGPTFEEDIILANPTGTNAQIRVTFLTLSGEPRIITFELPSTSRKTVRVNTVPGVETAEVSTLVESLNGVPIVAERTMYWGGPNKRGGHNSTGVESPQTTWHLAEGATAPFFSTYILIANPNPQQATVTVRFLRDGAGVVDHVLTLAGNRRHTLWVNDIPGMESTRFGATVTASVPVLVERAMYWRDFEGGHDAMAVPAPSGTWWFAEGHTGGDFLTYILLSNPNASATTTNVTFYLESGGTVTRNYTLPGLSRLTIGVHEMTEMQQRSFATKVTSTLPIVAERAMYWGGFVDGHAATGVTQAHTKWGFAEGRDGVHEGQPFTSFFLLLNSEPTPLTVRGTFYLEDGTGRVHDFVIPANSRYTLNVGAVPGMGGQQMAAFFQANAPFIAERATYWGDGWYGGHATTGIPWNGPIATPSTQPRTAAPVFSVPSGTYHHDFTVELSTTTLGATIRYTRDGSEPSDASTPYTGALTLSESTTIRARAFAPNHDPSLTTAASYTMEAPPPVFQHPSGAYPAPAEFGISTSLPGSVIRYSTDGNDPMEGHPVYFGPIQVPTAQTLILKARVFRIGWTPSATATAVYEVSHGVLSMPVPTPAAGVYFEGQTVTLSAPPSATIRYTTDGTDPTDVSPMFPGSLTLTEPTTLKARSFAPSFTPSNVLSVRYDLQVQTPIVSPESGVISGAGTFPTATTSTASSTLRYTLDRNVPTEDSPQFHGSVFVSADGTIMVRGFRTGWVPSKVASATYTREEPLISPGEFEVTGVDLSGFNRTSSTITFQLTGVALDESSVVVMRNGAAFTGSAAAASMEPGFSAEIGTASISLPQLLDGRNDLEVYAADVNQLPVYTAATVWAGNRRVTIRVQSASGTALAGAQVHLVLLADERMIHADTTDGTGLVSVSSLPSAEPFRVDVFADEYRAKSVTLAPGGTSLTVSLDRDNTAFQAGTLGWIGPVTFMPHSEPTPPLVPCPDCPIRDPDARAGRAPAVAAELSSMTTTASDLDIQLHTFSQPRRTAVYRFSAARGVREVQVRYRVQTGEPAPWPDRYVVSLRSVTSGRAASDTRTVADLYGAGALDGNQATAWMNLTLALDHDHEEIELRLEVENFADNANDTAVWADLLKEDVYEVSEFELHDYRAATHTHPRARTPQALSYLSAAPHTYYMGRTRVNGTITIRAPETARVSAMRLEILRDTTIVARADLVDDLAPVLLQPVGSDGVISLTDSRLMFLIQASQFGSLNLENEVRLTARVVVAFANGRTVERELGRDLSALARYTATNRFAGRDVGDCLRLRQPFPCGGDDWARPLTKRFITDVSDATWNDFSNMNGGPFPRHQTHQDGLDIDGLFDGYVERDAATARKMLAYLNAHRRKIAIVYVTYQRTVIDPFWQAIRNVTLDDGRQARDVIIPLAGHADHFHWRLDLSALP